MRAKRAAALVAWGSTILVLACSGCVEPLPPAPAPRMDFLERSTPFAAPFPSEHLRREDGSIDLAVLPEGERIAIVRQIHAALGDLAGFGTTSGVHLAFEAPLDPSSLPAGIVRDADALVSLVVIGEGDPHRGERAPIRVFFAEEGGPFGDENVLTALPVQGMPLRPGSLYALVVRRGLRTKDGAPFARARALDALAAGLAPEGLVGPGLDAYREAYAALPSVGIDPASVLGMAVFRTQDPLDAMRRAAASVEERLSPSAPFEARETFERFCVFETTMDVPVYQEGTPPYSTEGGAWRWRDGRLDLVRREEANLVVTLPRRPMPLGGFPLVVLVRTGAGGDRPLVDRGPRAVAGGPAIAPGTGPARDFAEVGWAGLQMDGPHGGRRNVTGGDEQFLVFNIQNPTALRDNLRQSALELILLARSLAELRIDASACEGLNEPAARFDVSRVALMGHSMGASIAPLAAAFEPTYRALVLSGAGASWIENVLHKERPIATRPVAEGLLGYARIRRRLEADDPVLNLLQWAGEEADAAVYAPRLVLEAPSGAARHVLVFQGIVDSYIPPPVANALTLALGADLAGAALDRDEARLSRFESVLDLLPLREARARSYPVSGNVDAGSQAVTVVVTQHREDGIEDGHEAFWQTEPPRAQLRCFLQTLLDRAPPVVAEPSAGCP